MVDIPTADQIARISPRSGRVDSRGPSPIMGQALAGFGQDLQRTSANLAVANYNMNVLAERQAQDEQKKRASDVSTSLTRFLSDWEQRFITARDEAPESGIGFTHAFMDGYQKQANAFAKDHFEGLGEEDQNRYLNAILTHGNALFDKAHAFEQATKSDYYGRITDQNLQTIGTQIAGNASNYDALKQQGIEAIDSVDMPEAWKADRRAKWAAEAEHNRFLWDYSQDPQQAIRAMNPVGLSGDAKEVIRQEEGFRPQAYWDVNHWRVGYGSDTYTTADGQVHEVTKDTVISQADAERDLERRSQEFADKAAAQVGPGWNTLPGNVRAALTSVAYNYGTLPNSVAAAARSGDVNATANAIEALSDNPDRRQREATIAREGVTGASPSPYSALSVEDRRKLADWGETQLTKQQNAERALRKGAIDVAVTNAPAAFQASGTYDGWMPGPADFVAAYGPEEGQQRYAMFAAKTQAGAQAYRFQTMPEAEIKATVEAARPTGAGQAAAAEAVRYQAMASAADDTIRERERDPARYTLQAFPHVAEAWQDASGTGDYSQALAMTAAAQKQLGIRKPALLPKDVADSAVAAFKAPDKSDDERMAAVTSLVFATPDPAQRRQVYQQLVGEGLPAMTEGALEAAARGDMGAAKRLMQAAVVDPGKLPANVNVKPADIASKIFSNVWADGEIGSVAYGLPFGDSSSLERAQRGTELLKRAVQIRVAQGQDADDAVEAATRDLFGDVRVYDGSGDINASMTVPNDLDTRTVTAGLQKAIPDIRAALTASRDRVLARINPDTATGAKAIFDATTAHSVDDIMSNGVFVNAGDGVGFRDAYTGQFVAGADGRPLIFPMDQITSMGRDDLAAKSPESAPMLLGMGAAPVAGSAAQRFIAAGAPRITPQQTNNAAPPPPFGRPAAGPPVIE